MGWALSAGAELDPAEIAAPVNHASESAGVIPGIRWSQNPLHIQAPLLVKSSGMSRSAPDADGGIGGLQCLIECPVESARLALKTAVRVTSALER